MKKILFFIVIYLGIFRFVSAQTSGEIQYSIFLVDTIQNTVETLDSVQKRFTFNSADSFWETKYHNNLSSRTISKPAETIYVTRPGGILNVETHLSDTILNDSDVLNYNDTNYIYFKNNETKTILGRNCKNVILVEKNHPNFSTQIWYDDSINCNSVIPGAGTITRNVKGIILEVSVHTPIGKNKMTATSLSFGSVNLEEFNPPSTN